MQAPWLDEIFQKWLQDLSTKDLEKLFGLKERQAISSAEYVKMVERGGLFTFHTYSEINTEESKAKEKKRVVPSELPKIKFFEIPEMVEREEWNAQDAEPSISTLQEVVCEDCKGRGTSYCKQCKNQVGLNCKECQGDGTTSCPSCKGRKVESVLVTVVKKDKRREEKLSVPCKTCFGEGRILCQNCSGVGTQICASCGNEPSDCDTCKGHSTLHEYQVVSIPFVLDKGGRQLNVFISKALSWILSDKNHYQKIKRTQCHEFNNFNEFTENALKELFGVPELPTSVKHPFRQCKKTFESYKKKAKKKKSTRKPYLPINLYFLTVLHVETHKGKKFKLVSVGTKHNFFVLKQ